MLVCGEALNGMKEGQREEATDLWSWPPCQFTFPLYIEGHVFLMTSLGINMTLIKKGKWCHFNFSKIWLDLFILSKQGWLGKVAWRISLQQPRENSSWMGTNRNGGPVWRYRDQQGKFSSFIFPQTLEEETGTRCLLKTFASCKVWQANMFDMLRLLCWHWQS